MEIPLTTHPDAMTDDPDRNASSSERLRAHRALLENPHASRAPFWDAVVLTACSRSQARGFRARLDDLHDQGKLPGARELYVVVADEPGPRCGSGGATIAVCRELRGWFGDGWRETRTFCLHAGGHSERAPQHGVCGKAFAEIPMDASGTGTPSTVLEAQLVQLTPLLETLPAGVFVSCADVSLEYERGLGRLDEETRKEMERGITALAHPSSVTIGEQHGVFACDATEVAKAARASRTGETPRALACRRCLQKPSAAQMRETGCVMGGNGEEEEWVLTDSCFHIGVDAVAALIELDATRRNVLAGCEICAYGDFMQPLGSDPDTSYLDRVDHIASVTSASLNEGEDRLRMARRAVAEALRGRPLIVIPLIPSRFIHLGTIPEFLHHTTRDKEFLRSLPAPGIPVNIASSMSAQFLQPEDSVVMWSVIGDGCSLGSGSCLVNCDIEEGVSIAENCALYDVELAGQIGAVTPGTFMYTLPLSCDDFSDTTETFVTIIMNVDDVVKSRTSSTICGVPVEEAARRLDLDTSSVWRANEAHTTTLARFFTVSDTARESATEALRMAKSLKCGRYDETKVAKHGVVRKVSISEVLRKFSDPSTLIIRQDKHRRRVLVESILRLVQDGIPASEWRTRAPHVATLSREFEDALLSAQQIKHALKSMLRREEDDCYNDSMEHVLTVGRVALSLCVPGADTIARECLRDVIVQPFSSREVPKLALQKRFNIRVSYPARFNLAGGWTDTPPYSLEREGAVLHVPALIDGKRPITATVTRFTPNSSGFFDFVMKDEVTSEEHRLRVASVHDLLNHYDPTQAFALHKAVVALLLIPDLVDTPCAEYDGDASLTQLLIDCFGASSLELRTEVNLPKGSGLGTSSILALAMLHAMIECAHGAKWKPLDESGRPIALAASVERFDENKLPCEVVGEFSSMDMRLSINSVLAVEQLITTGGGWQDQVGGAIDGLRLSRSTPGNGWRRATDAPINVLPAYSYDTAPMSIAAKLLINSRFACVFTGTCRLAKTVCDSVVTTWQKREPGVEGALQRCAALASTMFETFRELGEREDIGDGFGDAAIERLGNLLEEHKLVQQSLWSSIESPTIRAIYSAIEPLSHGSFICGAGSGGHVIAFLKSGVERETVVRAVSGCTDAPEARVVEATMLL